MSHALLGLAILSNDEHHLFANIKTLFCYSPMSGNTVNINIAFLRLIIAFLKLKQFFMYMISELNQVNLINEYLHLPNNLNVQYTSAKEWKRGTSLLYGMPFPFDVVKRIHKYALIFVSAPLC